jgi:hypothetical protein
LLVALERPRLDFTPIRNKPEIDLALARQKIDAAQASFLASAREVALAAEKNNEISRAVINDNVAAIEAVVRLIPDENSFFSTVEIAGKIPQKKGEGFSIDARAGQKIKEAYYGRREAKRTVKGTIVDVNGRSSTFVVKLGNYREITCVSYSDAITKILFSLKNGTAVSVTGTFERRKRRDRMWIDEMTVGNNVYKAY